MSLNTTLEQEITKALNLNSEELEKLDREGHYKSLEYSLIVYYTNSDLYYMSEEELDMSIEMADEDINTTKGRIFAFN
jgi:hypothetical protein